MIRHTAIVIGLALFGCSDQSTPEPSRFDASRQRRVFDPPPGKMRAVPPHGIHASGVGPFLFNAPLNDILSQLTVPRVVLFELDGVVDYSLVKAENDGLIIGVDRRHGMVYVSVLDAEVARHESGIGVGSKEEALVAAMGKPLDDRDRVFDPRVRVYRKLPNVRFVVEQGKVMAVLVGAADRPPRRRPKSGRIRQRTVEARPAPLPCKPLEVPRDELIRLSRLSGSTTKMRIGYGCVGTDTASALVSGEAQLAVVGYDGKKKLRRLAHLSAPGLLYAAALEIDGKGTDEIAMVSRARSDDAISVRVEVLRVEAGKLTRAASITAYQVTRSQARWVGAKLDNIELLIELSARSGILHIGGLYLQRGAHKPANMAPLIPKRLVPRHRPNRLAGPEDEEEVDAGLPAPVVVRQDAGTKPKPKKKKTNGRRPAGQPGIPAAGSTDGGVGPVL